MVAHRQGIRGPISDPAKRARPMAAWRASSGHFPGGYAVTNSGAKPNFYVRNSSPPCVHGLRTRPRLFPPRPGLFLTAAHAAVDCTFGGRGYIEPASLPGLTRQSIFD